MLSDNQTSRYKNFYYYYYSEIWLLWPKAANYYYIYEVQFSGYLFLIQVICPENYGIAVLWRDLKVFFAPVKTRKCNENSCNEFYMYSRKKWEYIILWKQGQAYFFNCCNK